MIVIHGLRFADFTLRTVTIAVAFAVLGLSPDSLRADEAEIELGRATTLFQEGRRLIEEGRYAEACDRFEQSLALADGIGTQFNLADCWQRLGRTASAQELFARAAASAKLAGQPEREAAALRRSAALEPQISRLAVEVQAGTPEVAVRRNGEGVSFETLGKALPVDPGAYEIEASAPGKVTWLKSVRVPPGGALVWVTVPLMVDAPSTAERAEAEALASEPEAAAATSEPESVDSEAAKDETPSPAPLALKSEAPHALTIGLLALGVGGVAAGTAFTLKYQSATGDAGAICESSALCTADDLKRYDHAVGDAKASRTGAFVSFGVGGVALAGAALTHWVFGIRPDQSEARGFFPRAVVGVDGSFGLVTRGRF